MVERVCIETCGACVCVCVLIHGCGSWVCVPGMQMKLKTVGINNLCTCRTHNKEGLHVFQPSCAACGFNSTTPLP